MRYVKTLLNLLYIAEKGGGKVEYSFPAKDEEYLKYSDDNIEFGMLVYYPKDWDKDGFKDMVLAIFGKTAPFDNKKNNNHVGIVYYFDKNGAPILQKKDCFSDMKNITRFNRAVKDIICEIKNDKYLPFKPADEFEAYTIEQLAFI